MRRAFRIIGWLFKAIWYAIVIATPFLGVWLASSLAAYLNGPRWAAYLAGVLAFPVLPLMWELVGRLRRRKRGERIRARGDEVRAPILRPSDRLILRTLAINVVFLGVLVGLFPQDGFTALSTRGDWMLSGHDEPWAERSRAVLLGAAGALEWLYNATRDNPYEKYADDERDKPVPEPVPGDVERAPTASDDAEEGGAKPAVGEARADDDSEGDGAGESPRPMGPPAWPMRPTLHPVVAKMPASAETSPAAVAKYIAQREDDPYLRVKALYDYVADRIRYDAPALAAGDYPPQDPETVFRTRKAVCAGYAKLLEAMADAVGIEMVYVTGVSREMGGDVAGGGHAWNAVQIRGKWYLIDATWAAGTVEGAQFTKRYTTDYLFTPAEVFGVDHFPDDARWQLRKDPLTRGEFVRQPMLKAAFFERGYALLDPKRSQISVEDVARITVERPAEQHLIAALYDTGGAEAGRCQVAGHTPATIRCPINRPGTYQVRMFSSRRRASMHSFIGQIAVNAR